ncbi:MULTISPECIES: helix-turn-helix transcriptional regulator [Paenibacillus]|uniref:helix-turn-helix transcriptional regulator n=1 Tax=Paenibacillus TaxID=44249 RepID=UPI0022B8C79E|nr:helix-turn-helix transcriptional regulator [Paenibacillus caseinilyticus]MCZ8520997.1 helix-turn-helix transcriptional regulator [Paenibacillus caseinilyticus]
MEANHNRKAIGEFLKKRRSCLSPEQTGLPRGYTRRRTPGLRREEVAQLADVSTTWYTWLEQGREVAASAEVLGRLASALQLNTAERQYLYLLSGRYASPARDLSEYRLSPAFSSLVMNTPYPFLVIGPENRLIAWNPVACAILADYSMVPPEGRQMLRLAFTHPAYRTRIVNWEQTTRVALSFYRKVYDRSADQQWYIELAEALAEESREFAEWWPLHEVADKNGLQVEIRHESLGLLFFEIITFNQINDLENLMCCIYMPLPGTQTEEKLMAWHQSGAAAPRL